MSDIAQKLLRAIDAKELKSHEASTHTYDEAGVMEMDPKSMEWQVVARDGCSWVSDQTGYVVALAADVDMWTQTWDAIPRARLEFMADNDPASVRRRCEVDREIVHECQLVLASNGDSGRFNGPELARFALAQLARGYGVTP